MERKLQERMVGAGVLILALVILGPMVLDGGSGSRVEEDIPGQRGDEVRTHTFQLDAAPHAATPAREVTPAPLAPTRPSSGGATGSAPDSGAAGEAPPPESAPAVVATPAPPPPPPAEPKAAQPAPGEWVVQVGTFAEKANAERLVGKLKGTGYAAFVSPMARDGRTLYRVRVGPAGARAAAAEVAARLAAAGQAGQLVRQ